MSSSSLAAATRKFTYRDFVKFPDDGKRHELIDGVHYAALPLDRVFAT